MSFSSSEAQDDLEVDALLDMSPFPPSHPSPRVPMRSRQAARLPNLNSMDMTTTSATSSVSAALAGLSPKDVELIDEIIERSPPSATTFLTVFKAYNEVLQERGMDAANDVVYYKILLKLGVVRGEDWGTKWRTVKQQQGYGKVDVSVDADGDATSESSRASIPAPRPARAGIPLSRARARGILDPLHRHRMEPSRPIASRRPLSDYARDTVTVHSHQGDGSEAGTGTETETGQDDTDARMTEDPDFFSSPTTLIPREVADETKENALGLSTDSVPRPPLPTLDQFLPVQAKKLRSLRGTSEVSSEILTRASSPPPVKPPTRRPLQPIRHPNIPYATATAAKPPAKVPPHDDSYNEEYTWKKVRMVRDEKEADKFREICLLERCWILWKGRLQRLYTRMTEINERRDKALARNCLGKWRSRLRKKQSVYEQIGRRHDAYLLRNALMRWITLTKTAKLAKWRDEMRKKMSLIMTRRDERILGDALAKWMRAYHGELAYRAFERTLAKKMLREWQGKLASIGRLEAAADRMSQSFDDARKSRAWELWRLQTDLRGIERLVSARVEARLKENTMQKWREKLSIHHRADVFYDRTVLRYFYQSWQRSLYKRRVMVLKADKYKSRQDGILLRALLRLWVARERGLLKDRTRNAQLLLGALTIWKMRLGELRIAEARAIDFENRPSSALVGVALSRWHHNLVGYRTRLSQAAQYDRDVLVSRALMFWRIKLRVKLKLAKNAKVARKYLLIRSAWKKWRDMAEEKKRENLLKLFGQRMIQKHFERWRSVCARQRYYKLATKQMQYIISSRILSESLRKWTYRVIDIKDRDLGETEKRNHKILTLYYNRWRTVTKRHMDELRLMQSYQYVKQEELLRRMFYKWYSATKSSRHRRLVFQELEEEMKLTLIEKAWDNWREKFKAERLAPLEAKFAIQSQKSCLYRAFVVWHSKTRSTPAIRFYSSRTKTKCWSVWREAMPKALQAREARKRDAQKLLSRALDKWAQAYRTKIALKAVARARYLRLPSGASRQSVPLLYPPQHIPRATPSIASSKATRPISPTIEVHSERALSIRDDVDESASRAGSTGAPRRRLSALRNTKFSLARPTFSIENVTNERRTDLWHELRRLQRKPMSGRD